MPRNICNNKEKRMGDLDIARGATVDISDGKISHVRVFEGYPRAYKTREASAGGGLMFDQANADMFRLATAIAMTADANFGSGTVSVVADFERGSLWSWKSKVPVNGSRWYDRAVSQDTYGQDPVYTEGDSGGVAVYAEEAMRLIEHLDMSGTAPENTPRDVPNEPSRRFVGVSVEMVDGEVSEGLVYRGHPEARELAAGSFWAKKDGGRDYSARQDVADVVMALASMTEPALETGRASVVVDTKEELAWIFRKDGDVPPGVVSGRQWYQDTVSSIDSGDAAWSGQDEFKTEGFAFSEEDIQRLVSLAKGTRAFPIEPIRGISTI